MNQFKVQLAQFFDDVLKSKTPGSIKDKIIKSEEKLSTNILYLTNQCNLKCDYCYQAEDRKDSKSQFLKELEVKKYFDNLCLRESNVTSTVVLFGGEPFLNEDIFYFILDYCDLITHKTGKKFNLSTTTNGVYFLDDSKVSKFLDRIQNLKNHFSLEISYDGSGHDRRVYPNGKSTKDDVKSVIKKLIDKTPITIRYTIHKDNYRNALRDLIQLSKTNIKKIVVNFFESELEELGINSNELKDNIQSKTEEIFLLTGKPICHLNCRICRGCNHAELKDLPIHYGLKDKEFIVDENVKEFKHFSKHSSGTQQNLKI